MKGLAGFVEFGNDFLMPKRLRLRCLEQIAQRLAIRGHAGGVGLGNQREFCIRKNNGADVLCLAHLIENNLQDFELARIGFKSLDSRAGLQGIGGIDDSDPVSMAKERQFLRESTAPIRRLGKGKSRSETNRTYEN